VELHITGDAVEACLVQWSEAARAFGDVERDRDARAVELIAKRGEKHAALARRVLARPCHVHVNVPVPEPTLPSRFQGEGGRRAPLATGGPLSTLPG